MSHLDFAQLLSGAGIAPESVTLMRHQPTEPGFASALPGLRITRPDLYEAYQDWQRPSLFDPKGIKYISSFIGDRAGRATYAGTWALCDVTSASAEDWRMDRRNDELSKFKMNSWDWVKREQAMRLVTCLHDLFPSWVGRLVLEWKTRGQSWTHRADRHPLPLIAIAEDNLFDDDRSPWTELSLRWSELQTLPARRRAQLTEWRAIYLIFDEAIGQSYVGSASGTENLLGRWLGYATTGDGGNRLLRGRDPNSFLFTILERLSPDAPRDQVEALEASWKRRLHTREPYGLNAN